MNGIYKATERIKIDYHLIPNGRLKSRLARFLETHGQNPIFLALINDLPGQVKTVELSAPGLVKSWQSNLYGSKVNIHVNPNYLTGIQNPGRTLYHEIGHQTKAVNKWADAAFLKFRQNNQRFWQELVGKAGSREKAATSLRYAVEERHMAIKDTAFSDEIPGEVGKPIGTVKTYAKLYLKHYQNIA